MGLRATCCGVEHGVYGLDGLPAANQSKVGL